MKIYVINYGIISIIFLCLVSCEKFKDDLEPNDSRAEATEIILGEEYSASLAKGDKDFFQFTTSNEGVWDIVHIEIVNKSDIVIGFKVYDEQGNLGITFTGSRGIDIPFNMYTIGGTYYISIYSMNDKETGDYTLTITNKDANDNNEPDDTFENARVIDTYPTGLLNGIVLWSADADYPDGDWEFFYVKIGPGKRVVFTLDPVPDDLEMHFKIYDTARNLINEGLDYGDGETLSYNIDNPTAGIVYIYIKAGATLGDSYDGSYYASFEETEIP